MAQAEEPIPTVTAEPAAPVSSVEQEPKAGSGVFEWLGENMKHLLINGAGATAITAVAMSNPSPLVTIPLTLATGTVVAGGAILRQRMYRADDEKKLLEMYREPIAKAVGKAPAQVVEADMRRVADPEIMGDKVLKPVRMELDYLDYAQATKSRMAILRSAVTTFISLAGANIANALDLSNSGIPFVNTIKPEGKEIAAALIAADTYVDSNMRSGTQKLVNDTAPISVFTDLKKMGEISMRRPITPDHTFAIVLRLKPELEQEVKANFGKAYKELTYRQKQKAVLDLEPKAHAIALTKSINEGEVSPTAIAFVSLDQEELLPVKLKTDTANTQALVATGLNTLNEEVGKHVAQLAKERELAQARPRTLH